MAIIGVNSVYSAFDNQRIVPAVWAVRRPSERYYTAIVSARFSSSNTTKPMWWQRAPVRSIFIYSHNKGNLFSPEIHRTKFAPTHIPPYKAKVVRRNVPILNRGAVRCSAKHRRPEPVWRCHRSTQSQSIVVLV